MNRQSLAAGPLVAVIAGFGIAACGGSSTGTPTPTPTPTPASINNAGGSFCSQAAADAAQLRALSTGLATSPGADSGRIPCWIPLPSPCPTAGWTA